MLTGKSGKQGLLALTGVGGLGLLACGVCCALPLIGALGLGAGIVAVIPAEPLMLGLAAVLLAVGAWVLIRSRGKAAPVCGVGEGDSCSTSGCGCGARGAGPPATAER